ncbi:nucleotidyltransferase domain-containing protein [soil metagenome]
MPELELKTLLGILRQSFQAIFGEQFDQMLLFGSRARGDARADSDIDVLVILRGDFAYGDVVARTSEIVVRLSLENDLVISTVFVTKERFGQENSPFLLNIRREGVAL